MLFSKFVSLGVCHTLGDAMEGRMHMWRGEWESRGRRGVKHTDWGGKNTKMEGDIHTDGGGSEWVADEQRGRLVKRASGWG